MTKKRRRSRAVIVPVKVESLRGSDIKMFLRFANDADSVLFCVLFASQPSLGYDGKEIRPIDEDGWKINVFIV